jgi:hypothetical protein
MRTPHWSRWLLEKCASIHALMLTQVAGHATGAHGAFKPYRIDAVSLRALPPEDAREQKPLGEANVLRAGRAAEALVRVLSNILERLHQAQSLPEACLSVQRFDQQMAFSLP